jgi:hypothetical protein
VAGLRTLKLNRSAMLKRFNNNLFSKLGADPKANIANLANHIGLLGKKANLLFFTKAHFAKAVGDFGWS